MVLPKRILWVSLLYCFLWTNSNIFISLHFLVGIDSYMYASEMCIYIATVCICILYIVQELNWDVQEQYTEVHKMWTF